MAELIVTNFRRAPVEAKRRINAEPGVPFAVTERVLAVPMIEWRDDEISVRLDFYPLGRPVSWSWLRTGERIEVFGCVLALRSTVFQGGRCPVRLVIDQEV